MGILLTTVAQRGSRKMASPKNELLPEESPRKKLPGDTPPKKALLLEDTPTKDEFIPEDTPEKKEKEMMKDKVYDEEDEDYDDSNLPEKTRHPFDTSLKLFPLHAWLYILYIVLAILLPIFGTLLILCGNYTNTGYFSLFAILNYPWPKLKLEDPNATATSLELLQLACWISGFFFWLFALYLVYAILVYHKLLWARRPWDREAWGGVRKAADDVLHKGKVRDEDEMEQFERLDKAQEEMVKYKRPLIIKEEKIKNVP